MTFLRQGRPAYTPYLIQLVDAAMEGRTFELRVFSSRKGQYSIGINARLGSFKAPWGTGVKTICQWPVTIQDAVSTRFETENDRLLSETEVLKTVPISRSTIRRWEALGYFPKRLKLGPKRIGWRESDIISWKDNMMEGNPVV